MGLFDTVWLGWGMLGRYDCSVLSGTEDVEWMGVRFYDVETFEYNETASCAYLYILAISQGLDLYYAT